jgi:hypothetical protein
MSVEPIDPDQREAWKRDPVAYEAVEQLHDAYDELRVALDERVNRTGLVLSGLAQDPERLPAARTRVDAALRAYNEAAARADELIAKGSE